MNLVFREFSCQVYNDYGVKGALLDADAASRAEVFRYHCLAVLRPLDYTFTAGLVYRAVDDAL